MPYTSHGHPYGGVSPDEPRPALIAKCGGSGLCEQCLDEATQPGVWPLATCAHCGQRWSISHACADAAELPAPAADLTDEQKHAERILRDAIESIEFGDVVDALQDREHHAHDPAAGRALHKRVDLLRRTATVTVTWAQDGEQAGDAK